MDKIARVRVGHDAPSVRDSRYLAG
jgi:hypothetical protein